MNRRRLLQGEAVLICLCGLLLIIEIASSVRANVWWIGRSVLAEQRFAFYAWVAVGLGVLFVVEGIAAIREAQASIGFVCCRGPFMLGLLCALILIARGWRTRTDVAPADSISTLSDLPIAVRILADPWLAAVFIAIVAVGAVFSIVYSLASRHRPL
jgi:hypothetical protein